MERKDTNKRLATAIIATVLIISTLQLNCEALSQVHSLSISVESPEMVGQSSWITVRAYDNENNPVSGASISLIALAMKGEYTWDYEVELTLTDRGDGTYDSSLTSTWAGAYRIVASTDDVNASSEIVFERGPAVDIVASSTPTQPVATFYTSMVTFYFADAYGNSLSPDEVHPIISPTAGWSVENLHSDPNGLFSFDLVTDNWGNATVTISDTITGISEGFSVDFPPLYFETEQDLDPLSLELIPPGDESGEVWASWGEDKISLKIGAFIPALSELSSYEMTLEYDSSALQLLGIRDWDVTDNFTAPNLTILSENSFKLNQSGFAPSGGVGVAIVDFEPVKRGEDTGIIIGDLILIPILEELLPFTYVTLKPLKRLIVPIKKWIVEGSNITEAAVENEFKKVEDNFNKAAKECKLNYWFVFLVEINTISKEDWTKYAGADGNLTHEETVNMMKAMNWNPERWFNIYNVPDCSLPEGALGWWYPKNGDGGPGGITIDQSKDFDNLTLKHELMHEFSKSKVKDSPAVNATAQGGTKPKNIMNYNDTGGNISNEQGELINEELAKRTPTYDADKDGEPEGHIYWPQKDNPGHDVAVNATLAQKIAIVSSLVLVSALAVIWLRKRAGKTRSAN